MLLPRILNYQQHCKVSSFTDMEMPVNHWGSPNTKISMSRAEDSNACKHSSSPIPQVPQIFLLFPQETAPGKSMKSWVWGRHFWREAICRWVTEMPAKANDRVAVSCLAVPSSAPLSLAISHIPCHHCIKERTGSKGLQECFVLRRGLGRWHTYYAGQINIVLLPLVVLRREGHGSIPVPAQAWKWLRAGAHKSC